MARKLTADDICTAITELEEVTRKAVLADILADLKDSLKRGQQEGEAGTWEGGFRAALECIESNYS